jgi:hypothetical protein
MSKRKFMNCHNITIERWYKTFGTDARLNSLFDQFFTLVGTRHNLAKLVRDMDVAYTAGEISKSEYREGKKPYEAKLKNIKPTLGRIFDSLFCNLLVQGNSGKCYICGCDLDMPNGFNRDHVFPKVMGFGIGGNMMPAHYQCNQEKDQRLPRESEVQQAVQAYEFADMQFNPRSAKTSVLQIYPAFSAIIPEPVYYRGPN